MLRLIGIPMMCLAMFSIAGGHWAVFQTIAWAQMLRDYSKNSSLSEAVTRTFDGAHPCPICMKIAREKQEQQSAPLAIKVEKKATDFVLNSPAGVTAPESEDFAFPPGKPTLFPSRNSAPPDPVPIFPLPA